MYGCDNNCMVTSVHRLVHFKFILKYNSLITVQADFTVNPDKCYNALVIPK